MSDQIETSADFGDADRPLEPALRTLADEYHRPPPPPREAMWSAIRAARDADRAGVSSEATTGRELAADLGLDVDDDVVALPPVALVVMAADARRDRGGAEPARPGTGAARSRATLGRRWAAPLAALAAALLLGIGLGRWTTRAGGSSAASADARSGAPSAQTADGRTLAAGSPNAGSPKARSPNAGAVRAGAPPRANGAAGAIAPRDPVLADDTESTRRVASAAQAPAVPAESPGVVASAAGPPVGPGAPPRIQDAPSAASARNRTLATDALALPAARLAGTYRVATVQHLGQAEALLTGFRAEPGAGDVGAAGIGTLARELLVTTRLLLDSPAAADPQLGPLLGDLETVLVQIVQIPAARAARERQLIAQSLDQSQLMTHLRAAVPSGPAAPRRSGE